MKLKKIRVTNLDLYDACPYCFFLSQSGVRQQPNENMELGSSVHKAIETWHKKNGEAIELEKRTVPFMEAYTKSNTPDFFASEYKFAVPLFDTGITLTGTIDLIKDDWIFEHKTSSTYYSQEKVDTHHQATAYSWAYRQVFQREEKGIRFNVLIKNKTPLLQTLDTFRTDDDYRFWEDWVRGILKGIDNDQFQPKSGRWHNYKQCMYAV